MKYLQGEKKLKAVVASDQHKQSFLFLFFLSSWRNNQCFVSFDLVKAVHLLKGASGLGVTELKEIALNRTCSILKNAGVSKILFFHRCIRITDYFHTPSPFARFKIQSVYGDVQPDKRSFSVHWIYFFAVHTDAELK